jgi:hypothetical protein
MIAQWCALCLVGHSRASAVMTLVDADGCGVWVDPLSDVDLIRGAVGVMKLRGNAGQNVNTALTTYGGTPVCAWHLDEEIGRRRLCR